MEKNAVPNPAYFSDTLKKTKVLWKVLLRRMYPIEEVWRQKPRQIVVVAFLWKMAAHLDCVAEELIQARRAGPGQARPVLQ